MARYSWAVTTALLEFEIRNVATVKVRRGELSIASARGALGAVVYPPPRAFDGNAALRLAQEHALTYYDAAYLQLALETGADLITLDGRLLAADPSRCVNPSVGAPPGE